MCSECRVNLPVIYAIEVTGNILWYLIIAFTISNAPRNEVPGATNKIIQLLLF